MKRLYPPVVVILGPTAVGKSKLALELAANFGSAIVTADSRQVYRYMDIGTDKPSPDERAAVPHYMLDLVAPDDPYSAQRFRHEGDAVLRGLPLDRPALIAGGTGFYVRALLDAPALPPVPPNPTLRDALAAEAAQRGTDALHARLAALDPLSADRIHPHNLPRVIRALEIVETLGGPVPSTGSGTGIDALYLGLRMERRLLKERTDRRIAEQIRLGLVDETARLLAMGYSPDLPALQGFGYRQMVSYLRGDLSLRDAISQYETATHGYIRRQMTWFRKEERIVWLDADTGVVAAARRAIDRYLATVASSPSPQ